MIPPYHGVVFILDAPNPELFARADARLDAMLEEGFEREVSWLTAAGYGPALPALSALGYREIARAQAGGSSREEAIAETRRATRSFIRRQCTWFKSERDSCTLDPTLGDPLPAALAAVKRAFEVTAP